MTTALGWFAHCLRHYAQFSGRASRPEYWWFQLVVWVSTMLLRVLTFIFFWTAAILIIWDVVVVIPHLAVASRRLHDAGHSFWWIVPPAIGACFLIGPVVFGVVPHLGHIFPVFLLWLLFLSWLLLVAALVFLLCKRGNEGPNRYGDPAPTTPD